MHYARCNSKNRVLVLLSVVIWTAETWFKLSMELSCTLLFKSNGIFILRWQNMVFIFKVQTWNFVCGIRWSFAFTMKYILSVWYTATPGWTSKFGKVWKTRCQNAATRANIWRCFLVSWDDKYLWVMVSNNRHELYFCSKLLCFSSIHWFFFCQIRYPNIRHERTLTSSPLILKCSERCRETQEREPAHTGWCLVMQPKNRVTTELIYLLISAAMAFMMFRRLVWIHFFYHFLAIRLYHEFLSQLNCHFDIAFF